MSTPVSTRKETQPAQPAPAAGLGVRLAIAWSVVGVPLAYGVYQTAKKAAALFV